MKKLTAGIFTVLLGLVAANSADAAVASKGYVDEMVGANTTAIATLGGTVAGHTQSIANLTAADTAINAKIGTLAEGKTVVEMIAAAKQEAIDGVASYDDTEVRGLIGDNANAISANAGAISALETKVGNSSVADQIDAVRATTIAGLSEEQKQTMVPSVFLTEEMIATSTMEFADSVSDNTKAIQDINNSAVMKSGITADKVAAYDGYAADITANATAAANAQAAAEAAQGAADAAQDAAEAAQGAADANAAAIAAINDSENGLLKQVETAAKDYADGAAATAKSEAIAAAKSAGDEAYDAKGAAATAKSEAIAAAKSAGDEAYDAKGAAATAEAAAKAYADGLATNYDAAGSADAAEAAAVATAKGYTDAEVKKVDDKLADYALKSTIGEVESGKTVVQMISEAETAATYDDTEVRGLIGTNKTATETNAAAINTINEGAVMNSGITADKVTAYNAYAGTIAENTAAAEAAQNAADAAQGAADAAQQTANNAIPKPSGECAKSTNKCVLTFNNAQYAWEVIERNEAGE